MSLSNVDNGWIPFTQWDYCQWKGMGRYPCPCNDYYGGNMKKRNVIYQHMIRYGCSGIIPCDENNYPDM